MATKLLKGVAIKPVECWSTKSYKHFVGSGWFRHLILDPFYTGFGFCAVMLFYELAKLSKMN